jgi:hemolysin expression modulating protein
MRKSKTDYLLQFRRCQCLDTLEKVYSHMREQVTAGNEMAFLSAYDHRKAELAVGRNFDKVPASAWRYVN